MSTLSIVLGSLLLVSLLIIINLFRKNERYEDNLEGFMDLFKKLNENVNKSEEIIENLDSRGFYRGGDDDINFFFVTLKNIQKTLSQFKLNNIIINDNSKIVKGE